MKQYFSILILHCAFVFGLSTERVDIIKQTDGTVYKGKIIEQNIKDGEGWVKIEIAGGSVIHITKDKIESIESEEIIIEESKIEKRKIVWQPGFWFYMTIIAVTAILSP